MADAAEGAGEPGAARDDADGGGRVAQLHDLPDATGPGAHSPVADFDTTGGGAAARPAADLADLTELSGNAPSGTAAPAITAAALRPVERAAAPVAGLDGAGVGAAAGPARTADLDTPTSGRRRRRPDADEPGGAPRPGRRARTERSPGTGTDGPRARTGVPKAGAADRTREPERVTDPGPDSGIESGDDAGRGQKGGRGRSTGNGRWGTGRGAGQPAALDPDADPVAAAREICLRLLADRARTRHELAQALHRKGVPDDAAEQVLGRFDEVGLIDDAAFAGQWVRSRHQFRGLGRRAIAQELRRKGVDDEIAGEALAEVDGAAEEQRARQLVDRKLRSMRLDGPDDRKVALRRLVGMLARKGYGGGVAYGVVRTALAEHGAEIDEIDGAEPPDD